MTEEMIQVLIPMVIGTIIGLYAGFILGKNNPKKSLLRIAYLDGRIDMSEGRTAKGKYE